MRQFTLFDQIICRFDHIIKAIPEIRLPKGSAAQTFSVEKAGDLSPAERQHSASLMRVNHSGEVCAQALYLGQAFVTRNQYLAKQLFQAADEEKTHLQWCSNRIQALGDRTSFLNPLWAVGSFGIGVIAGLAGDKISLGFLAETEQQVTQHLIKHQAEISPNDKESLKILKQMQLDEERHATHAIAEGGVIFPKSVCFAMSCISKIMTVTARYI
jgi:ubiquinone biosynthesis monooxygenase Coq7